MNVSDAIYGAGVNGLIHSNCSHSEGESTTGHCIRLLPGAENFVIIGNNFGLTQNSDGVSDASSATYSVIANNLG